MKNLPTISQIKSELESKSKMVIEYEIDTFVAIYFNKLVQEFPAYHVFEIRPLQKIWISEGIDTKIILPFLDEMLVQIKAYTVLRDKIFTEFLAQLNITDIEGNFYKLRRKLQETNDWPKGKYQEWNYWSHGGDIEFDNISSGEHFNIRMSNIRSLDFWSIHKFIIGTRKESEIGRFLIDKKEVVSKMFDLLVVQKKMIAIRTELGEKQYELLN